MSRRKYLKEFMMIILMTLILLIFSEGEVKAALQANPNTQYKKSDTPINWMTNFRKMEETGGAMGLSESFNSDLTASSDSNNIDVHMMKSTEYGAIAILSASGYGNSSNDRAITSTTGNNTGVMLRTYDREWVAGVEKSSSIFSGVNSRYFNSYTTDSASAKIGDALGTASTTNPGCVGWHSAEEADWVTSTDCFTRGYKGLFAYCGITGYSYGSRGVAVCGVGL